MYEPTIVEYLRSIEYKIKIKANFDVSVELFKLGFISLDDFLKSVKRYAPDAPIDEEAIKQQEVERLQQKMNHLEMNTTYAIAPHKQIQ